MPETQTISFQNGRHATAVFTQAETPLKEIVAALAINQPNAVIVSLGGADELSGKLQARLTQLYSRGIARAAIETGALIIDGGTKAGVMSLMGEAVASRGYQSPLLGVAPAAMVQLPGSATSSGTPLEPSHSHFVLTPGDDWGAETPVLFDLVRCFTGGESTKAAGNEKVPVTAVLAGGGDVSKQEALLAVRQNIPLIVINGSGGIADEIAAAFKNKDENIEDAVLAEIVADGELHFHHIDKSVNGIERLIIRKLGTDKVLLQAWETFATYDLNANLQQAWFNKLQTSIIVIGVLTTALVVIQQAFAPPADTAGGHPRPLAWLIIYYSLILLPILFTVLITAANRFKQGNKWLLLRAGAESIKREIFSYRVCNRSDNHLAEQQLAKKMEDITRRTMQTEVNLSALKPYNKANGFPPYTDSSNGGDDGFSSLTPDRYVAIRLTDQFNYYSRKTVILEKQLTVLYWSIFIVGGLGAFLAAVGQQLWIALTTSLVAALGTYLGFRQTENTLVKYNQTSTDLANIKAWWNALSAEQQANGKNITLLVKHTEQVLQMELDGWIQRMQNALADLRKEQTPAPSEPKPADEQPAPAPEVPDEKANTEEPPAAPGKVIVAQKEEAEAPADEEEEKIFIDPEMPLHQ